MRELEQYNYFFGYVNEPDRENPMKIFDYKEHSKEGLADLNGFTKMNKESMEWITKKPESLKDIKYHVNAPDSLIKMDRPYYPRISLPFIIFFRDDS